MKRSPMSRGSGFKRAGAVAGVREERTTKWPPALSVPAQAAIQTIADACIVQPKTAPKRNRALLDLARGMRCLLCVPGICQGGTDSTVACHSNLSIHGKAGARKADDQYSVWGCMACHRWLDQGPAPSDVKEMAFMLAHIDQVLEWRHIAVGPDGKAQRAAAWALDELGAWPVGWLSDGKQPVDQYGRAQQAIN